MPYDERSELAPNAAAEGFPTPEEAGFLRPQRRAGRNIVLGAALLFFLGTIWYVFGGPFRTALLRLFPVSGLTLPQALTVAIGGPVVLWLIIALHEAGHVLSGLAGGFQFEKMAAGLLLVESGTEEVGARRGLRLRINRHLSTMAGYSVCLPVELEPSALRRGMLFHVAGGPASSLAVGIGGILLASAWEAGDGWSSAFRALLLLLASGSMLVGIATLIPLGSAGLPSDGARLLGLMSGRGSALRETAVLAISGLAMRGVRPRDWPDQLVAHLDGRPAPAGAGDAAAARSHAGGAISPSRPGGAVSAPHGSALDFWAQRYLHFRAWDTGSPDVAGRHLRAALHHARGPSARAYVIRDVARFCRWTLADPRQAAAWMALV
ncbi:MAG: hypothetical protein HKN29_09165, partial [Rhodothermales bacterium]|nr:hypothetical protein [Rhodothermales bacterium]